MSLMLTALVPQSALAQTPPEAPQAPSEIGNLQIRIEEEVVSAYNATARLNTTAIGRIIVNNTENRTITNAVIRLNSTTATNLNINNTITVPELPPGETVVAAYNVTTQPRLSLSHESKSITALQEVEKWLQAGEIDEVGKAIYTDPHSVVFGMDNVVEFNVTVANVGTTDLANVAVSDLLPNQTVNGSLVAASTLANVSDPYGAALAYDDATDGILIPLLQNGTSTTLTFRATVPASALADPETDFFDMRHEIRAAYEVFTEFTQEPTAGVTPTQERLFEAAKLEQAVVEQASLQQAFETEELLEIVDLLDATINLPAELNDSVFEKAEALGIPVDTNATFAALA